MKGITPVIALILLLVITIVIVGFTFTIFQSLVTTAGQSTERQTEQTTTLLSGCAEPEGVSGNVLYVRNCGTTSLDPTSLGVYANGVSVPVVSSPLIPKGQVGSVQLDLGGISPNTYDLRVVGSSGTSITLKGVYLEGGSPVVILYNPENGHAYGDPPVDVQFDCAATDNDGIDDLRLVLDSVEREDCVDGGTGDTNSTDDGLQCTISITVGGSHSWNCKATDGETNVGYGITRTFTSGSVS
jgi:flagellin-like protein